MIGNAWLVGVHNSTSAVCAMTLFCVACSGFPHKYECVKYYYLEIDDACERQLYKG